MNQIIGTKETAKLLGVSIPTVWRWAKNGELDVKVMVGKQLLFDRAYIETEAQKRNSVQKVA